MKLLSNLIQGNTTTKKPSPSQPDLKPSPERYRLFHHQSDARDGGIFVDIGITEAGTTLVFMNGAPEGIVVLRGWPLRIHLGLASVPSGPNVILQVIAEQSQGDILLRTSDL